MTDKLQPCPFCGSNDISKSRGKNGDGTDWFYIECSECACCAEVDMWNKRQAVREAVPEVFVLVPVEPTEAMLEAALQQKIYDNNRGALVLGSNIYKAMIAAAKETPHSTDSFTTHEVTQAAVRAGIKSAPFSRLLDELKAVGSQEAK